MDGILLAGSTVGSEARARDCSEGSEAVRDAASPGKSIKTGNGVGSPSFGRITNTRFPTGESGSSRQVQLGIKVMF